RGIARSTVAAYDVIVEHALKLPALLFGHLGEVGAAVESLFFAGDGEKNDGCRELVFAEHTRALKGDGGAAAVIIGAGRRIGGVLVAGVARIVVSGHQVDTFGLGRIRAFQDGIDILNLGRHGNAALGLLHKGVSLNFQTAVAF